MDIYATNIISPVEENHRSAASPTLSHNVVSSTPRHKRDSSSQLLW